MGSSNHYNAVVKFDDLQCRGPVRLSTGMWTVIKIFSFVIILVTMAYFGGLVVASQYSCKESSTAYCLGESTLKAKEQVLRDLAEFKRGLGITVQQD